MAPEQISSPAEVDHRADLYSAGVMLYVMVTYRLPYETTSDDIWALMMEKVMQKVAAPRSVNPQVPLALDGFILRLMETKPSDRFASAQMALSALDRVRRQPDSPLPANATF